MNILHITSLLPADLQNKQDENDILLRIAQRYKKAYPEDRQQFIMVIPYSNRLLADMKKKWSDYFQLRKKGGFQLDDFQVQVIAMPYFMKDAGIKRQLTKIGLKNNIHKVRKILDDFQPDIVHAHNLKGNVELAQLLREKYSIPFVASMRNDSEDVVNRIFKRNLQPSALISVNQFTVSKYDKLENIPVEIIPHPVDEQYFVASIRKTDKNNPRFVSVARLLPLKNFDKVLMALADTTLDFVWDIYGDGPERGNLQKLIYEKGMQDKIILYGRIPFDSVMRKLPNYDLFLMPSFPETLGRAYFEAMACGVPVIAAKHTGIDGIVTNEKEGFLVDHNSPEDIRASINNFIRYDEARQYQMKLNSYNLARRYTWKESMEKYKSVYRQAVNETKQ
ncbi:MAG: glycosyltransferase [Bacteroidales bacterium]|nr:glycosyltransferase [Bacteroidales bacterium]